MQTEMPFFEGVEDALRAAVQALGGTKAVGCILWPDKTPDNAGRLLADCLNPSRSEKLDYSQLVKVFQMAKERGIHAPFSWYANECGYESKPITKAEEIDRLTHVVEESSKTLAAAVAALERIQRANNIKVA